MLSLGVYITREQSRQGLEAAFKEANLISTGLTSAVAEDLLIKNYGGIEQTIIHGTANRALVDVKLVSAGGRRIVEAKFNPKTETWDFIHGGLSELPASRELESRIAGNHIITWAPIVAGGLIGWVCTDIIVSGRDLSRAEMVV